MASLSWIPVFVLLVVVFLQPSSADDQCPVEPPVPTKCAHVPCRFPCEPAPHDPQECNPQCICPKTPEEACKKVNCSINTKCEAVCGGGKCQPICTQVKLLSMKSLVSGAQASEASEPGFKPCPVVGCRFPCEPSPPNRAGCDKSCVCPRTVERACTKISCPSEQDCTANCDDCVCIPFCRTKRFP